jgi:hypothetical protein
MQNRIAFGALTFVAIFLTATAPAISAGAVAIGEPADVAKDGVSMGYNSNKTTMDEAKARALAKCKTNSSVPSKALCKIVATFSNQCAVEAIDPRAGTPGFGWAIADNAQDAQKQAMANCRESDGPAHQDGCQFSAETPVACDGSAK